MPYDEAAFLRARQWAERWSALHHRLTVRFTAAFEDRSIDVQSPEFRRLCGRLDASLDRAMAARERAFELLTGTEAAR